MPRKKKEDQGNNDKPLDMNVQMYENTRNRMLGTSKVIRLMKLWKIQEKRKDNENS